MGSPASGKSTFWQTHLSSYARINRDTLKTREKCLKVAEETMSKGQNLVIDNTNPSARDRKDFIDLAKSHGKFY
jgi:bifunctional polynucleotide phosphatase/kinase